MKSLNIKLFFLLFILLIPIIYLFINLNKNIKEIKYINTVNTVNTDNTDNSENSEDYAKYLNKYVDQIKSIINSNIIDKQVHIKQKFNHNYLEKDNLGFNLEINNIDFYKKTEFKSNEDVIPMYEGMIIPILVEEMDDNSSKIEDLKKKGFYLCNQQKIEIDSWTRYTPNMINKVIIGHGPISDVSYINEEGNIEDIEDIQKAHYHKHDHNYMYKNPIHKREIGNSEKKGRHHDKGNPSFHYEYRYSGYGVTKGQKLGNYDFGGEQQKIKVYMKPQYNLKFKLKQGESFPNKEEFSSIELLIDNSPLKLNHIYPSLNYIGVEEEQKFDFEVQDIRKDYYTNGEHQLVISKWGHYSNPQSQYDNLKDFFFDDLMINNPTNMKNFDSDIHKKKIYNQWLSWRPKDKNKSYNIFEVMNDSNNHIIIDANNILSSSGTEIKLSPTGQTLKKDDYIILYADDDPFGPFKILSISNDQPRIGAFIFSLFPSVDFLRNATTIKMVKDTEGFKGKVTTNWPATITKWTKIESNNVDSNVDSKCSDFFNKDECEKLSSQSGKYNLNLEKTSQSQTNCQWVDRESNRDDGISTCEFPKKKFHPKPIPIGPETITKKNYQYYFIYWPRPWTWGDG